MNDLVLTHPPVAKAALLLRRPVADVFAAFVDPEVTTAFWFTHSTGPLAPGARVTWSWEMYGVSAPVVVEAFEPNRRLVVIWGDRPDATIVEWRFEPIGETATYVTITNSGFTGDGDGVVARALDAMGGFTSLLAGAKAFLEHGLRLELVRDKVPTAAR